MMRSVRSIAVVLATIPTVAACAGVAPADSGLTVVDSAGVRIVTSVRPDDGTARIVVSETPLYRIGWDSDDPPFQRIGPGFLRPDGSAVFADGGANTIYHVSPDASEVTPMGREGEGPGEFNRISALIQLGADSFVVGDGGNNRVSFYAGTELVRDVRFAAYVEPAIYDPIARHADGSYWIGPTGFVVRALSEPPARWIESPLLRTRDFAAFDTTVSYPFVYAPGNANPIRRFGELLVGGESLIHAQSDRAQIMWLDSDGAPRQIARWDAELRTFTAEDWDVYADGFRRRNANQDPARIEQILRDREAVFEGTIEPVYRSAKADATGAVWLAPYDIALAGRESLFSTHFDVVAANGAHLGAVVTPANIRIIDISNDRILAVERDDFDVEAVAVYLIDRRLDQ